MRRGVLRGSGPLTGFGLLDGRLGKALASVVGAVVVAVFVMVAVGGIARGQEVAPRAVPGGFATSEFVRGLVDPTAMSAGWLMCASPHPIAPPTRSPGQARPRRPRAPREALGASPPRARCP